MLTEVVDRFEFGSLCDRNRFIIQNIFNFNHSNVSILVGYFSIRASCQKREIFTNYKSHSLHCHIVFLFFFTAALAAVLISL